MDAISNIPASSRSGSTTDGGPGAMRTPAFFEQAPRIVLRDALADTLGAAAGGVLAYEYLDAVKLAGHSCPTVAGAYLMTRAALAWLYPGELPRRGELRVELREPQESGTAGVVAAVVGLITGAAGAGGFQGLAGRHARRNLLSFGAAIAGELRFTRLDSGRSVQVSHRTEAVARPAGLADLMRAALAPDAEVAAREAFAAAWQGWVRTIVLEHADDPAYIQLHD
jgi:hypothetical protein